MADNLKRISWADKSYIGKKVVKFTGRPFKSGLLENTVKDLIIHPGTGRTAFIFEEDTSYVEAFRCCLSERNQ